MSSDSLQTFDQLILPLQEAARPKDQFRTGIELEFLVVDRDFKLIPYQGAGGVAAILSVLSDTGEWSPIYEKDNIIGLYRGMEKVTTEPTGAIEFSSAPERTLHELEQARNRFLAEALPVVEACNASLMTTGAAPLNSVDSLNLVPKQRYAIMNEYMPRVGSRGREMMRLTAAIQATIDYCSEQDAMQKFVLASKCTPFFIALSANSFVFNGKVTGKASERAAIWENTDPDRSGIPEFVFTDSPSFQKYVEWALDTPMYFVERGDRLISGDHPTFRTFFNDQKFPLKDGPLITPQVHDWDMHLSTLFPWVRLRNFLEIRTFDMNCPSYHLAYAALLRGLFYDSGARKALDALLRPFDRETLSALTTAATSSGLDGTAGQISLRQCCADLLDIAAEGLGRFMPSELPFLEPLKKRVQTWSFDEIQAEIHQSGIPAYLGKQIQSSPTCTDDSAAPAPSDWSAT